MARPIFIRDPLRRFAQPLELPRPRQPLERLRLDLADALGGQSEAPAGLAQRGWLVAVDAVAQPDHLLLLVGQLGDRAAEGVLPKRDLDLLVGGRTLAGHEVAQSRVLLADRPVEARDRARGVL